MSQSIKFINFYFIYHRKYINLPWVRKTNFGQIELEKKNCKLLVAQKDIIILRVNTYVKLSSVKKRQFNVNLPSK